MAYKGRALYNLLQMNLKQNSSLNAEHWQVEDYQSLADEELFSCLESHQIFLDKEHFLLYVEECDAPEDLTDCLSIEDDYTKHEQVFLCVFELWRRMAPHKQTLSIFADEMDHLIEEYEEGNTENEEKLQAALLSFQRILDDHIDEGGDPLEGFEFFSAFSCHDLEVFIYEYVAHQIDRENDLYASELLEGFYEYVENKRWFDFLRMRLVSAVDLEEANVMIQRLLESLQDNPDIQLLFEVLHFLVYMGENEPFIAAFQGVLNCIETEDDLREVLVIASDYMNCLEKFREEEVINDLIEKRKDKSPKEPVDSSDYVLQILRDLITFTPA